MAPQAPDDLYLPSLEPCLRGQVVILSWRHVAEALADSSGFRPQSPAVINFLQDAYIQSFFTNPATVFPTNENGKHDEFVRRTAAIQVTPTSDGKYDINTIKEDSLWLSKEAKLDVLAALRIVVIEFQSRPDRQLSGPISTQDAANLLQAAGATNAQSSTALPGLDLSVTSDAADIQTAFGKPENRRRRIFQSYLSERRYFAMTANYVLTLCLYKRLPTCEATAATDAIRMSLLAAFGMTSQATADEVAYTRTFHALLSTYIDLLPQSVDKAKGGIASVTSNQELYNDEIQLDWPRTFLTEAYQVLTISFQLLDLSSEVLVSPKLIEQWFKFVDSCGFFQGMETAVAEVNELLLALKGLVSIISITMLNLPRLAAHYAGQADIDSETEYLGSSNSLELIHNVLLQAANNDIVAAVPVMFAWVPAVYGMFLSYQERIERRDTIQEGRVTETYEAGQLMNPGAGRRNSAGSITSLVKKGYDEFLTGAQIDRDPGDIKAFAQFATNNGLVYDIISDMAALFGRRERSLFPILIGSRMRLVLLELLKATYQFVDYKSEVVETLLVILSGEQQYWDMSKNVLPPENDVLALFLEDEGALEMFLVQARNRFPYEFLPFISFCRIVSLAPLAPQLLTEGAQRLVLDLLMATPTLTLSLPAHFQDYELPSEDEQFTSLRLTWALPLFDLVPSRKLIATGDESFVIPAGTYGRFVADTGRIVQLTYEYSPLALLGKRLEANLSPNLYRVELGMLDPMETSETIALLATVLGREVINSYNAGHDIHASENGRAVITEASRALPRTKDIITVVCDTLDVFLEADPDLPELMVLSACLQFLDSALPLYPGRVISYMSRCAILGNEAQGGRLSRLVGSLELSNAHVDLLSSAVRLIASLVDYAMISAVQRKKNTRSSSRNASGDSIWLGMPDKTISQVVLSVSQTAVDVFESTSAWRFPSESSRSHLIHDVALLMHNVMYYTFSMDDLSTKKPLTAPLEPGAKYVVDSFLSPSAGSLRIGPILSSLIAATQLPDIILYPYKFEALSREAMAILRLATTLVRIANFFDRSSTTIETQLFRATPFIARACAASDRTRLPAILLLEALVVSAGKTQGEPPSLLGYLGHQSSLAFLQFLSVLDKPYDQLEEVSVVWRFFSTIVRNRQQWMANCLLTGKTPSDARHGKNITTEALPDSVLSSALDRLSLIHKIPAAEALAILDFVTSAQNYWPWTIFTLNKNKNFLKTLRRYSRDLSPSSITARPNFTDTSIQACNEARIAAYIAETFAMQLFHLRQIEQAESLAKELSQDLDYFLRDGVEVGGYNATLHRNFSKNFAKQFPSCILDNFKRTLLAPRIYGRDFYYALEFADQMLEFDTGWQGSRNNGFRDEMERANVNLSLVDAQIALFHSWECLLLELSTCLPNNDTLKKQSLQVAKQCLEANQTMQGPEQIFERLAGLRVNLALTLVQRVVDSAPSLGDITQLLMTLWSTISGVEEPYSRDNIVVYRTLLRLLFVTLRAHAKAYARSNADSRRSQSASLPAVEHTVLSILDRTVARGFRNLASLIHDPESSISPADMAMINAVLQACLCIPGIEQSQTQILNILASHEITQVAMSLYSWSDKLALDGDPIYGELSLLFLRELSALPQLAEQLATEGLLNQITAANLAKGLQNTHVSPFADSVGLQRCYSIWSKGIVPMLLNILTSLGAAVAPEVAYVLNHFSNLTASSVVRFEDPSARRLGQGSRSFVTLLMINEVHSLALLTRVLAALRANNARDVPEVEWDSAGLLENIEFWLGTRNLLRDRLFPMGPTENEWRNTPSSPASKAKGFENKLEEIVVAQLESVRYALSEDLEKE